MFAALLTVFILSAAEKPNPFEPKSVDQLKVYELRPADGLRTELKSVLPPNLPTVQPSNDWIQLEAYLDTCKKDIIHCMLTFSEDNAETILRNMLKQVLLATKSKVLQEIPVKKVPKNRGLDIRNMVYIFENEKQQRSPVKIAAAHRAVPSLSPAGLNLACFDISAGYYDTFDAVVHHFFVSTWLAGK